MDEQRTTMDGGAILVWMALALSVLLGFGALVIDVGRMYVEKRELQNGADAAAIAAAMLCAGGTCASAASAAGTLADANSQDGRSDVALCGRGAPGLSPCPSDPPGVNPTQNYVTALTSTVDPSNDDSTRLNLILAPLLESAGADPALGADASAAFGALSSATTLNLTMSMCEYLRVGGVIGPGTIPATVVEIYFREESTSNCVNPNNGFALPGGFGWLNGAVRCNRPISVPGDVPERPGKAVDNDCDLSTLVNTVVALPVFTSTNGLGGSNGSYHVDGFVSFRLTGYSFPGRRYPTGFRCSRGASTACITGNFTTALMTSGGTSGTDYGTRAVELVD